MGSCFGHRLCFPSRQQRRDMARFAYTAPPRDWMNRWGEDYAQALPYFEEAVQRTPRYAEAWFKVGVCNGELGRWHEAVTDRKSTRLNSSHEWISYAVFC